MTAVSITCPFCLVTSYHPRDVETGYCTACHDFTSEPEKIAEANRATLDVIMVVLDRSTIPRLTAGEPLPPGVRKMLLAGPDVSLRHGPMFYGVNGEPLEDDDAGSGFAKIAAIRETPGAELTAELTSHLGAHVTVSTAYLGIDMSTHGPMPLPWETIVFVGRGLPHLLDPIRYMTRAAAHAGHAKIVALVRHAVAA